MENSLLRSKKTINAGLIFVFGFLFQFCADPNQPTNRFIYDSLVPEGERKSPEIISLRRINLDENPDLEVLVLVRNGTEEILAEFGRKRNQEADKSPSKAEINPDMESDMESDTESGMESGSESDWDLRWKKSFRLLNIGPLEYSSAKKSWVPTENFSKEQGFIVKSILTEELAGDNFNSVFLEVLSEEPPLGLFSIPYGFRKGIKILDGLSILKEHPKVQREKRADLGYKKEDKLFSVFPNDRAYALDFVFNGFEVIPGLSSQPIPAITYFQKIGENRYKIEFKNRGGYSTVTYLSLSFPGEGKLKSNSALVRIYPSGSSIYSGSLRKYISSKEPLLEITKEAWGQNVRFSVEFEYEGPGEDILIRSSYRYNGQTETIPNESSLVTAIRDQQGYLAYRISLPKTSETH
jgi:hypothetical protein